MSRGDDDDRSIAYRWSLSRNSDARASEIPLPKIGLRSSSAMAPTLTSSNFHNPPNDAADISQSLQRLGFDVTSITDATLDRLRHALIDFGRAARDADTAVLFFAGHGMEILGENWLLPIDAELKNDVDVDTEAVSLRSAMLAVSNAKAAWPRYSRRLQEQSIFWQNAPAR